MRAGCWRSCTAKRSRRVPPHGWPQRLRRMLRATDDATVRRAAAELPDEVWRAGSPDRPTTLVHGDWHLGQLGRPIRALGTDRRRRPRRRRPGVGPRPARPGSGRRGSSPTTTGPRSSTRTATRADPRSRPATRGRCLSRSPAPPSFMRPRPGWHTATTTKRSLLCWPSAPRMS